MRAKFRNREGVPSPAMESEKYFAGIKVLLYFIPYYASHNYIRYQDMSTRSQTLFI